ncbi:hypothetical protein GQ53DRAFT_223544 [Thozetella sp. PMI_491]|nr:hypothetical protein GQ53DRAFT_223544 [Thozetella sp. PMI_491]
MARVRLLGLRREIGMGSFGQISGQPRRQLGRLSALVTCTVLYILFALHLPRRQGEA